MYYIIAGEGGELLDARVCGPLKCGCQVSLPDEPVQAFYLIPCA